MTLLTLSCGIAREGQFLPVKLFSARVNQAPLYTLRSASFVVYLLPGAHIYTCAGISAGSGSQLWWCAEEDNAQAQQVGQAALDTASGSHTYTRHASFG